MSTDLQRVTVNLITKSSDSLDRLASRSGMSKTDVINRALQLYDFIDTEIATGKQILIRSGDDDDQVLRLI